MPSISRRRHKKRAVGSKNNARDLGWLEGYEDDAFLTRCSTSEGWSKNVGISGSGRKRKCQMTNDSYNNPNSKHCDASGGITSNASNALPYLLHLREIGIGRARTQKSVAARILVRGTNSTSWRSVLLRKPAQIPSFSSVHDTKENDWVDCSPPIYNTQGNYKSTLHKQLWRKKRIIPFSKLKTPITDAILAIDRLGGYLIGIGGSDFNRKDDSRDDCNLKLLLKFYGVPSPNRLQKHPVSPLMHTVPLLMKSPESENRNLFGFGHFFSAAETPVQILFSDDGSLGVAFLRNATETSSWPTNAASQDEDALGTIVIFEMPSIASNNKVTRSFHCPNIRIGGLSSFTLRNSLWPTNFIPVKDGCRHVGSNSADGVLCDGFRKSLSAYMLFNDEDDGFRITWLTAFDMAGSQCKLLHQPHVIRPSRKDIVVTPDDDVWEMKMSHSTTGRLCESRATDNAGLDVPFEVYLNADALLSDILDRRRQSSLFGKSPYQSANVCFMPEFCYNLVSVDGDHMQVLVVLVMSNREKLIHTKQVKLAPSSLGVFVNLNLYDQSYNECLWVSHPRANDMNSMKNWCNSLALNYRMSDCGVGLFCLGENSTIAGSSANWVCRTHEHNSEEDLNDDTNVALWTEYAERRSSVESKSHVRPPKAVSMTSLFPSCDVVSNRAVTSAVPLTRMTSRQFPIEVVYG